MLIDLRSDTVTRPSDAMRRAMATAEVGDDCYRDDPTARRLEERAAELLGKEAAVYVPTGTMGNQIALLLHCRPGDEVLVSESAHIFFYEAGAGAAWAGAQFIQIGGDGSFDASDVERAVKPIGYHFPRTRLLCFENTHNRSGGRVFPQNEVVSIAQHAKSLRLSVHLDGARIWNAAVASGKTEAELAAPADTVTACFSKGLGAPIGSVIAGTRDAMDEARRFRRMLGGGMRQSGVLCAAALFALEHNRARLTEDHENARELARGLAGIASLRCDAANVETNMVMFEVRSGTAQDLVRRAAEANVLMNAVGPTRIRAVTHLDVSGDAIRRAVEVLARVA